MKYKITNRPNFVNKTAHIYFNVFFITCLFIFFKPLKESVLLSFNNALYSHFPLIPLLTVYLFYKNKKHIFFKVNYSFRFGIPMVIIGMMLYGLGISSFIGPNQNNFLSLMMFSFVICILGGFILFYGNRASHEAMFPLLFLFFIVPIPTFLLDPIIQILVIGSTEISYGILKILGIHFYREGFVFELPGIAIEVAKQCSGIRSTLALFITSIIAGQLFLKTGWRRVIFMIAIFPITIFKNALRITTLALLASYVDPAWVTNSWLHKAGGKPFFILALLFLFPVLWLLHSSEKKQAASNDSIIL